MEPPKPAAPKGPQRPTQTYPRSRNRLRIGTGHPQRPPPISKDEIVAELQKRDCDIKLIVEMEQAYVFTVREEDIAKMEGQTLFIRHHKTRVDVYLIKNDTDRRMEEESVPASSQRAVEFKVISVQQQPFAPVVSSENHLHLVLKNHTDLAKRVVLLDATNKKHFQPDFKGVFAWRNVEFTKKKALEIPFAFKQVTGISGVYHTFFFLTIETFHGRQKQVDRVSVPIEVIVADREIADALAPKGEYVEKKAPEVPKNLVLAFPDGRPTKEHIHTPHERKYVVPLEHYETPEEVQKQILAGETYKDFSVWNTKENWRKRLLLWWEEAYGRKQVTKYDLWDTAITHVAPEEARSSEPAAEIRVPGLEEKRPSLLKGDRVYVWQLGKDWAYEGIVWDVRKSSILALFGLSFYKEHPGSLWHVRFTYDRLPMRVKHRAVDAVDLDVRLMPPSGLDIVYPDPVEPAHAPATNFVFEDLNIADNQKQSLAVRSLASRTNVDRHNGRTLPFLLLGPFGTGKTRCLVEYAKQALKGDNTRLLFCSFSNSTADRFCVALKDYQSNTQMFRLNAFRRDRGSVLPAVWPYCAFVEDQGIFDLPALEQLKKFRVIVCTANNAGSLYGLGCGKSHFTHIIVDEAARLEEPECLIPLSLANLKTQVVLAGDPKQLGPKVQSSRTKMHGLEKSLPERLCQYHLYADKDERVVVHLTQNYRCHREIVNVLDRVFYDQIGLSAWAPTKNTESLATWNKRGTTQAYPFLFISSSGSTALREADSPSYFNVTEAEVTAQILQDLVGAMPNLKQWEIGVLPATRKQTEKIRKTLRLKGLSGVDVGSVEEAHGKEFKVVLLSCVATARGLRTAEQDRLHDIGFCANGKRLNTAISRAAALVIIVGDPFRLGNDPQWKAIIEECRAHRCYIDAGVDEAFVKTQEENQRADEEAELKAELDRKEARLVAAMVAAAPAAPKQQLPKTAPGAPIPAPAPISLPPRAPTPSAPTNLALVRDSVSDERDEIVSASPVKAVIASSWPERPPSTPPVLTASAVPFTPKESAAYAIRASLALSPVPTAHMPVGSWPSPMLAAPDAAQALRQQQLPTNKPDSPQQVQQPNGKPFWPASPVPSSPHHGGPPTGMQYVMPPYFMYAMHPNGHPPPEAYMHMPPPHYFAHPPSPSQPKSDGFSSKYSSLGFLWNREDLLSYRNDSAFVPPFRIFHRRDTSERLEIVFYTAPFIACSDQVRSEGRMILFSFFQKKADEKEGDDIVFSHSGFVGPAKANTSLSCSYLRICLPQGFKETITRDGDESSSSVTFTLQFLTDAAPVSVVQTSRKLAKN